MLSLYVHASNKIGFRRQQHRTPARPGLSGVSPAGFGIADGGPIRARCFFKRHSAASHAPERARVRPEVHMLDRFVVEDRRRVVGIAVKAPGGFKFYASDPAYSKLEDRIFRRVRSLVGSVEKLRRKRRRRASSPAVR